MNVKQFFEMRDALAQLREATLNHFQYQSMGSHRQLERAMESARLLLASIPDPPRDA